jgi:mRNA interferase RelE/StbE
VSEAPRWDLRVLPPARRQLDRLPISVAAAVLETLDAITSNPKRLGKPLRFELEGCWSARRGPYRVIYRVDDVAHTVSVLAVAHRADVYRPR